VSIEEAARFPGLVDGQPLTEADAEGWIPRTCFKHGPPGRIGIELEFVVHRDGSPARHLSPAQMRRLFDDLDTQQFDSKFTVEPGGQVELSSRPAESLPQAISLMERDLALLTAVLARHGAKPVGTGIDPLPPPDRHLRGPRYSAMEEYFDRWGSAGRAMMRSTASVQVNVEAGRIGQGPSDVRRRWDLLHAIGPALVAAFANSPSYPVTDPGWAGFANLRQGVWLSLDPARCKAPAILSTESLQDAWTRWVLDAPLLLVRRPDQAWTAPPGLSFRHWLRDGVRAVPDAAPPTLADLSYHLSTLFPPVRARGHLEVRYLDAQTGADWRVPAAVVSVLADDDAAGDAALAACEPLAAKWDDGIRWQECARFGLVDPDVCRAARQLMAIAADALERGGQPELAELTASYLDRRGLDAQSVDRTELEGRPC
jgi:glutamate--cysteine ligase